MKASGPESKPPGRPLQTPGKTMPAVLTQALVEAEKSQELTELQVH